MNFYWFRRKGIFFIPVSWPGWLILAISLVCSIYTFIDIDSQSHSVSDTMINFVFSLLIIAAVYSAIAFFTLDRK